MKNFFKIASPYFIAAWMLFLVVTLFRCTDTKPPVVVPVDSTMQWVCKTIADTITPQERAVGAKGSYWTNGQTIRVLYMGGTAAQRKWPDSAFALIRQVANLSFSFVTSGNSEIRIAFTNSGNWSYIGRGAVNISQAQQTINLGNASLQIALHEIGHAIGLLHEQAHPIGICWQRENVIRDLSGSPNFWSIPQIEFNVLTPARAQDVDTSPFDDKSIMLYNIPASWVCQPHPGYTGGKVLSTGDKTFIQSKYPFTVPPPVGGTVTITTAQRDNFKRITEKVRVANNAAKTATDNAKNLMDAAKVASDSLALIKNSVFGN